MFRERSEQSHSSYWLRCSNGAPSRGIAQGAKLSTLEFIIFRKEIDDRGPLVRIELSNRLHWLAGFHFDRDCDEASVTLFLSVFCLFRGHTMRVWIDGLSCSLEDVLKMVEEEIRESEQPG